MIIWFPIESGYQYPRLTMKLPVKVRASHKKIAFFFFHRLVPPFENMGGRKRVRSDKTDMSTFWQVIWTFVPHQVPCRGGGRKSGRVANRWPSPTYYETWEREGLYGTPFCDIFKILGLNFRVKWRQWSNWPKHGFSKKTCKYLKNKNENSKNGNVTSSKSCL